MYFGFCFTSINGNYMPPVNLPDAESCLNYCRLQHHLFPEVRITDESDSLVMHVIDHVLEVPFPNNILKRINLLTNKPLADSTY